MGQAQASLPPIVRWWRNLSLLVKQLLPLGLILVLFLLMAGSTFARFEGIVARGEAASAALDCANRYDAVVEATAHVVEHTFVYVVNPSDGRGADLDAARSDLAKALTELPAGDESAQGRQFSAHTEAAVAALDRKIGALRAAPPTSEAAKDAAVADLLAASDAVRDSAEAARQTYVPAMMTGTKVAGEVQNAFLSSFAELGVSLAFGLALTAFLARALARRVRRLADAAEVIRAGDLTHEVVVDGRDEVGQVARSLGDLARDMRDTYSGLSRYAQHLTTSAGDLNEASGSVADSVRSVESQADQLSDTTQAMTQQIQHITTGAQDLGLAIAQIAENAHQAAMVAGQAVSVTQSTSSTVSQLGESSREIGDVVKVITSIAEQTNLLALNATIEAARAGEAGKGFAVVASEVKELASETARATENIAERVSAIQIDTKAATDAIREIAGVIGQINDFQTTIAAAVEEQAATTREMGDGIDRAATASASIARTVQQVDGAAKDTLAVASSTHEVAQVLTGISQDLVSTVAKYTV